MGDTNVREGDAHNTAPGAHRLLQRGAPKAGDEAKAGPRRDGIPIEKGMTTRTGQRPIWAWLPWEAALKAQVLEPSKVIANDYANSAICRICGSRQGAERRMTAQQGRRGGFTKAALGNRAAGQRAGTCTNKRSRG